MKMQRKTKETIKEKRTKKKQEGKDDEGNKKKNILVFDARITLLIFIFDARIILLIFVSCSTRPYLDCMIHTRCLTYLAVEL